MPPTEGANAENAEAAANAGDGGGGKISKVTKEMIEGLHSEEAETRLAATASVRKLLSVEVDPPIDDVISSGVVPRLVELLSEAESPDQRFEAAWALTNIASGTSAQTTFVVEQGALRPFIQLLGSEDDNVREQGVWALGNIAGDSHRFRDMVLDEGILPPLLDILNGSPKITMIRNCAWVLSNLFRFKPQPELSKVSPALETMSRLLDHGDHEVLTDTLWAFSYLCDGPNDRIQALLDSNAHTKIIELLKHDNLSIVTPALRTVGNIATGDDTQTQAVIGCLPLMSKLLQSNKESIKKEACWTLSNITAGTEEQVQAVIDAGLFPAVIELLEKATFITRKEAAWAVANATHGTKEQVAYLINADSVKPMCDLLSVADFNVVVVALEFLENVLAYGEQEKGGSDVNPYAAKVEEAGALDKLTSLVGNSGGEADSKASFILDRYFNNGEEEEGGGEGESSEKKEKSAGGEGGATNPFSVDAPPEE